MAMSAVLVKWAHWRLMEWGEWRARRVDGIGYAARTVEGRLMDEGLGAGRECGTVVRMPSYVRHPRENAVDRVIISLDEELRRIAIVTYVPAHDATEDVRRHNEQIRAAACRVTLRRYRDDLRTLKLYTAGALRIQAA